MDSLRAGVLALLLGILVLQQLSGLPDVHWSWALVPALFLAWRFTLLRLPALFACGFLWALIIAQSILSHSLPIGLEGKDVVVEGHVASLPGMDERYSRFEFDVARVFYEGHVQDFSGRVILNWYQHDQAPKAGDHWRFMVRLKRPHGLMNPGGFDYEGWLFRHRIRATGYVRVEQINQHLAGDVFDYPVQQLRQYYADRIHALLADGPYAGVITALVVGEENGISHEQWLVFTRTGTGHLVAISGSHISLIAGLIFFLVRGVWARHGPAVRWPAPKVAALAALAGAIAYALLAGFTVPTQRAVVMVAVVMMSVLFQRHHSFSHTLAMALLAVLMFDPLAVMDAGFWLSFCSVAIILFGMSGRVRADGWWWKWGRLHVLIAVGLIPVMLVLFQRLAVLSPVANFIAVPWITFIVTPLALSGAALIAVWPSAAAVVLDWADMSMAAIWPALEWMSQAPGSQWTQHVPPVWVLLPGLMGVVLFLAPKGLPGRRLAAVYLLPLFFIMPPSPAFGEAWFTLLDVGQGLAAVVRTSRHTLIYDTGPRFGEYSDMGEMAVIPYLRQEGVSRVDTMIISHGDMDHRGGAESVLEQIEVGDALTIDGTIIPPGAQRMALCGAGQSWQWDGVDFRILHPPAESELRENNASCVLRVRTGGGVALLPGDIEKRGEHALLENALAELPADILVAPHHGSNTSSTEEFLATVQPRYVLFPVGYRNRYGFPRPAVVERYEALGSRRYDTARHGAIIFHLPPSGAISPPDAWRRTGRRYWHTSDG